MGALSCVAWIVHPKNSLQLSLKQGRRNGFNLSEKSWQIASLLYMVSRMKLSPTRHFVISGAKKNVLIDVFYGDIVC